MLEEFKWKTMQELRPAAETVAYRTVSFRDSENTLGRRLAFEYLILSD